MLVDPTSREEWQQAVDAAEFLLQLDSARQYGLITGGPSVKVDRCIDILRRGREQGIEPSEPGDKRAPRVASEPL